MPDAENRGELAAARLHTADGVVLAAERLGAIVKSSDDAIVSKDLAGIVTSWNGAAERIFGYLASEMIGRSIQVIIPPERRSEEDVVIERVRRGDAVDHFETVRRRKDGSEVAISLTVSPIRDASGTIVGASKIARDITDRKRHEAEREGLLARAEQARAEAERANSVKDEFLAILSHELRSPLNAISGWAQLASGQVDEASNPTVRRALKVIERNVALQLRLINDLLDVSRIMSGKLPLRHDVVELGAVAGAVVDGLRPEAMGRGVGVTWQAPAGRLRVIGDAARLEQVVWNLLSNALKFTPRDGRVTVSLTSADDDVCLTVQDTGEGIVPEFLPHVFGRFRQADATITRRHGGLGLGLAVVSHLVQAHGGRITAESAGPGLGATFTARFPAAFETPERDAPRPNGPSLPLEGLHVLVVEDDADARELLDMMLRERGLVVTAAGSMQGALDWLHGEAHFQVLVSDLAMPVQDGFALIAAVRADRRAEVREIAAVAITAHADDEHRRRALAAGFNAYVPKPVDAPRVIGAIERVLRRRADPGLRPPTQ